MKILFLTDDYPPFSWGGAGLVVYNLANHFAGNGHEVFVITSSGKKENIGKMIENGVTIYTLYSSYQERWRAYLSLYNPKILWVIRKIIKDIKPDVVHAHNIHYHLSYASLGVARGFSLKVFITLHDAMAVAYGKIWPKKEDCGNSSYGLTLFDNIREARKRFNPLRNILIKRELKQVDKIFVVSEELKKLLSGCGIANLETSYNGLHVLNEPPMIENNDFLASHNLLEKSVLLLGGRVNFAKGAYAAMDALVEVKKEKEDVVLIFAGVARDEKSKLEAYADKLFIIDNIRILSWLFQEEMKKAYAASKIVLVPSLYLDPFPNANLEAAFYKKPVIATCFGGSKEFVVDGKTGYIVNPYDKNMLSEKILDLLRDDAEREEFGLAAFQRLKNVFSLDKQADKLLKFYQS